MSRLLYVNPEPGQEQAHAMIGGNTKKDGDVGILYLINKIEDVKSFTGWMKETSADAYVVLLAESVMAINKDAEGKPFNTFTTLKATGKLAGVRK